MDRKKYEKVEILEDRNLGFLKLSDVGVHGVSSKAASTVNDKLVYERAKANEVMKKINCKIKDTSVNKQNEQSLDSPDLNYTDYEPYRIPKSINISDLITENTIRISNSIPSDNAKTSKISFEPSEITGRSTHIHQKQRKSKLVPSEQLSVEDILSSSFAPKVRNLRDSISSTSSINYNGTHSLPRTADMSKDSSSNAQVSFDGAIVNSFGENFNHTGSAFNSEDFNPAELMESKLIADEISWAEECAAMPAAILSKDAKEKAKMDWKMNSFLDSMSVSNSLLAGDKNFSFGKFFNERLENLSSFLPNKYPDKCQNPRALFDDPSLSLNSKEGRNTFNKCELNFEKNEAKNTKKHDSKDSGTASDNSCVLSLSAIDRALANLDLQSDDSPAGTVKNYFERTKKQVSPTSYGDPVTITVQDLNHLHNNIQQKVDIILQNKENLDPNTGAVSGALSDTLSFSDSILNSSDLRKEDSSINKSRSPLSPLENAVPKVRVVDEWDVTTNGADLDEWPSPPIKSNNRRVVRKKSPKDKGIINPYRAFTALNESSPEAITPTNKNQSAANNFKINKNSAMIDVVPNSEKPNESQMSVNSPISSPGRGVSTHAASPYQDSPDRTTPTNRAVLVNSTEKLEILRSTSPYSSCSEFSHRDGKLIPLKVTAFSLSWCSVKLRSAVHKSIQVKNTSNKRLVLRAEVNGPGFQILNTQNTSNITLHSQECRTITISFCPTVTGVAVGDLSLSSPHSPVTNNNAPYLRIPLYAFGGHASIKILEALRAPDNTLYLPMGNVNELPRPLEQTFKLYNNGPMIGFAKIFADSSSLNLQRDVDSFVIKPNHVLIMPDSSVVISVVFNPKREYLRKIIKKAMKVQILGNLRILSGDEVHRQRLRRIVRNNSSNESEEILGLVTNNDLNGLWNVFPNEIELSELEALKDDIENVNDFISCISLREIALTLNFDELNDTTLSSTFSFHNNIDETVIFRTPNPTRMPNQDDEDLNDKSDCSEDENAVSSTKEVSWSVHPNNLNMDINAERRKDNNSFLIINFYKSRRYFEISCNIKNLLIFTPSEGYVGPDGGKTKINVSLKNNELLAKNSVMINVYIENERISIPVKFS